MSVNREPHNPAKVISALERERDSLAARASSLEAENARLLGEGLEKFGRLREKAQEVRRAKDECVRGETSAAAWDRLEAAIDALVPPVALGRFIHSAAKANAEAADLRARLSRAREALADLLDRSGPLARDLIGECERAMRQRDEWARTGVGTSTPGQGWDTCFSALVERHLAALRAALAEPPGGP